MRLLLLRVVLLRVVLLRVVLLRGVPLLCVLLLACGCSSVVRTMPPPGLTPAHQLTVFTDGFHSGVVLDKAALPVTLDPQGGDEPASWPQQTLHFGELKWTAGYDNSMWHALGLVIIPGEGVVQSDHTRPGLVDVPGLELGKLRMWNFPVNQEGMDAVVVNLKKNWFEGEIMPREIGTPSTLYPAQHTWSVYHNCHDFTLDLLRSAGLDLYPRWLYLAGGMTTDLDEAQSEMARAGVTVIGK
jgi:hypothetical protein